MNTECQHVDRSPFYSLTHKKIHPALFKSGYSSPGKFSIHPCTTVKGILNWQAGNVSDDCTIAKEGGTHGRTVCTGMSTSVYILAYDPRSGNSVTRH